MSTATRQTEFIKKIHTDFPEHGCTSEQGVTLCGGEEMGLLVSVCGVLVAVLLLRSQSVTMVLFVTPVFLLNGGGSSDKGQSQDKDRRTSYHDV